MKLRKNTGYTFTNCKKALEKFDNDVTQVSTAVRHNVCVSVSHNHKQKLNNIVIFDLCFRLKPGCTNKPRKKAGPKQTSWKDEKPKRAS